MNTTPQRKFWSGNAVHLDDVWTLRKRNHVVQCKLFTHPFGWELRLEVGELFMTQVCKSDREIEDVFAAWKAAMILKGWCEHENEPTRTATTGSSSRPGDRAGISPLKA